MTHLTEPELVRWRDEGRADDRARVVSHLAECDVCRRALVALMPDAAVPDAPAHFDPRDFVEAGYAAGNARGRVLKWRTRTATWIALAAAAAAVLVVAIALPRPDRDRDVTSATRSGDVQLLEPRGSVPTPTAFRWSSGVNANRYRVRVRAGDREILTTSVTGERLDVSQAMAAQLTAGIDYTWTVDALDKDGTVIVESPPLLFRITPR